MAGKWQPQSTRMEPNWDAQTGFFWLSRCQGSSAKDPGFSGPSPSLLGKQLLFRRKRCLCYFPFQPSAVRPCLWNGARRHSNQPFWFFSKTHTGNFLGAQQVKGLVLLPQRLRSLLWRRLDPWPGNLYMPRVWWKKENKKASNKFRENVHNTYPRQRQLIELLQSTRKQTVPYEHGQRIWKDTL